MGRQIAALTVAVAIAAAVAFVVADDQNDDAGTTSPRPATTSTRSAAPKVTRPGTAIPCPDHGRIDPSPSGATPFDARVLLGRTEHSAERKARQSGCALRVVLRDGRFQALTDDLRSHRVNVEVEAGVVVRIDGVY